MRDPNFDWKRTYERVKRGGIATPYDLARIIPRIAGGAGEAWAQLTTIGKEVTAGTAVATTRKIYGNTLLKRLRVMNLVKPDTGTRDNQRDAKVRAVQMEGTFDQPISTDEILELLAGTLKAGVTPTAITTYVTPAAGTAVAGAGSTAFAAGTYTFAVTQWGPSGESLASATGTVVLTLGQQFTVTGPALAGTATNTNVYLAPVGAVTPLQYAGTAAGVSVVITAAPAASAVGPPTAVGQKWVYTPLSSAGAVDTTSWEWNDGARNWQARGVQIDTLALSGVINGDTKATATLFGREMIPNAATAPPAERLPDFVEGWEVQFYIDPFGGAPGTTLIPGALINWDCNIKNNLSRKYFGDNTTAAGNVILGELGVQSNVLIEASSAQALTEYNARDTNTKRLVRIQMGNNKAVSGGQNATTKKVQLDLPGVWSVIDLTPEDAGTKVYKLTQDYVYDPTNAFGVQVTVTNARPTLYSAT